MIFVDDIPLVEWLEVIPESWRTEIINRVDGLRIRNTTTIGESVVH